MYAYYYARRSTNVGSACVQVQESMVSRMHIDAPVYPDVVLPSQQAARARQITPEHRLMVAVLIDAVDSVTRYRSATDKLGRRVFAEDTEWFLGGDDGRL